jgi:hypothetical protein
VLDRIANRGYMAGLRNARKNCIKDFGHDTEKWKKMVPLWCRNSNNLVALCDEWATKGWQDLSKKIRTTVLVLVELSLTMQDLLVHINIMRDW